MQLVRLEPETLIAEEGSQEAFLLLLVTGTVEGFVRDAGRNTVIRSFTSGDIIGEMPLLERGSWPVCFRALDQVTALRLTREGLEQALVGNPDPRGFLEVLREQHNDRDVAATLRRYRAS